MPEFRLSRRSYGNLEGVHADLIRVVEHAISITNVDFAVLQGVRTLEEQKDLVAEGASQTLDSKHLTGDAVDLGAWVRGTISWHEGHYYPIAEAMRAAAEDEGVIVRWGGCWERMDKIKSCRAAVVDYVTRCRDELRTPFLDLGHFELITAPDPARAA